MTTNPPATPVETEYGTMHVRRVTDAQVDPDKKDWTASYAITGRRVTGLVHVRPQFRREVELLPSFFQVQVTSTGYDKTPAHFTVNGVDIDKGESMLSIAEPEDATRFRFRRALADFKTEVISDAANDRMRAALRSVLEVHIADTQLVWEHATAYARYRLPGRRHDTTVIMKATEKEVVKLEGQIEAHRQQLALLANFEELANALRPAAPEPMPERTPIATLAAGDRVTATGNDTRGHTVTRVGRLLAEPEVVTVQDWGKRVKKWRLHISDEPDATPTRSNSVTLHADGDFERLPVLA
ncbi:hypothetical protein [Streptomyces sp. SID10815]|uniref:hypothetical protein n=1 Tax=Streptomyces sp. SID10815 TaxID=2706027 RepID=UPI0013C565F4|nr:hypothetical protein [Streptomyces sp. SID10815]NEA50427.1 hypothetical protein [Streptomyces sp. SID10815]